MRQAVKQSLLCTQARKKTLPLGYNSAFILLMGLMNAKATHTIQSRCMQPLVFCLFFITAMQGALAFTPTSSWVAWSAASPDDEADAILLFIGKEVDNKLVEYKAISTTGFNVTPSLTYAPESGLWLAWVNRKPGAKYMLQYANIDPDSLSVMQAGILQTQFPKIYSPDIALIDQRLPIIAWASFDGTDEEINFSYYNRFGWTKPISVTANQIPDTRPTFSTNLTNMMVLKWLQLSSSGETTQQSLVAEFIEHPVIQQMLNPGNPLAKRARTPDVNTETLSASPPAGQHASGAFIMGTRIMLVESGE